MEPLFIYFLKHLCQFKRFFKEIFYDKKNGNKMTSQVTAVSQHFKKDKLIREKIK